MIRVCLGIFRGECPRMVLPKLRAYIPSRVKRAPIKTPCLFGRFSTIPQPPFLSSIPCLQTEEIEKNKK
uniref:Uncharacterized protein n=1 Tax=Rhizophora mucronata TaxID=61149 RepID=A0A2P2IK06_RHIMU